MLLLAGVYIITNNSGHVIVAKSLVCPAFSVAAAAVEWQVELIAPRAFRPELPLWAELPDIDFYELHGSIVPPAVKPQL